MKIIFFFFALLGILTGCKQDEPSNTSTTTKSPVAAFSYQIKDKTVTFSNKSTDATTFEWKFGDGNTSSVKNPSHTYAAEGAYQVTLTASNEVGSSKKAQTVTLIEEFEAIFLVNVLDDGVTIQCTDKTVNATKWSWDFGDKTTSTEQNPKHTYSIETENIPNTFIVMLTATSASGKTASAAANVTITKPITPKASFTYLPAAPKVNEEVRFFNSSSIVSSYAWDFGDGTTATDYMVKHTYTKAGTYSVSLTVSNGKLSDTKTQTIIVSDDKPAISKVKISKYTVKALNWKDGSGGNWDLTNGPDVFIKEIYKGSTLLSFAEDKSKRKEDVTTNDLPYSHTVDWTLTDLSSSYTFKMYDYDPIGSDELMASFVFNAASYSTTQPAEVELNNNGCKISLTLSWE